MYYPLFLLQLFICTDFVFGHGRLIEPPARSSAWREDKRFPTFETDNQMDCGGTFRLASNNGRCGICGEEYYSIKRFEKGGSHYTGISVRHYQRGQIIDVKVNITNYHLGWNEFRICNVDGRGEADDACLQLLTDLSGQTRIPITSKNNVFNLETKLRLPADLVCNHCVFQWKYHTGNNWGRDTAGEGLGHGPQAEFYGCADVTIEDSAEAPVTQSIKIAITPPPTKAIP